MSFAIEKNIPIPRRESGKVSKYPFKDMQVKESFLIPDDPAWSNRAKEEEREKIRRRMISNCTNFRKRNKCIKFKISAVSDGVRVWRVK